MIIKGGSLISHYQLFNVMEIAMYKYKSPAINSNDEKVTEDGPGST